MDGRKIPTSEERAVLVSAAAPTVTEPLLLSGDGVVL